MMYSVYKLNRQGDNIQPWCTPFLIWNQSVVPCPVLTVASWPAYRFLKRQVRWSGIPISFRIFHSLLFDCGPQVKGFGIVNKAEIDVFLELSCSFNDPADVDDSTSGSSDFSKTSLNICKFTVHVLLKPVLENFGHYFTSMWDECNWAVWRRSGQEELLHVEGQEQLPWEDTPHPKLGGTAVRRHPMSNVRAWAHCFLKLSSIQLRLFSSEFPSLSFSEVQFTYNKNTCWKHTIL